MRARLLPAALVLLLSPIAAAEEPRAAWPAGTPAALDAERFIVDAGDAPARGAREPLVTLVVFSDFECPFCQRVSATHEELLRRYPNELRLVFRHNPLPFHQNAMPAAEAAMEAYAQQGYQGFWRMHDQLFRDRDALDRASLELYARRLGLDVPRFVRALDTELHRPRIERDMELARRVGATGTPGHFLNGRPLPGAQPLETFTTMVDEEIAHAEAGLRAGVRRADLYAAFMRVARERAPEPPPPSPRPSAARQADPAAVYRVPVTGDEPVRGPRDALVTLVLFSDFQCPFCARLAPTLEELRGRYGDELRVVWMNNPLPFHREAGPAATFALEAQRQRGDEGFWAAHDRLFANQLALGRADLERYGAELGLDGAALARALDSDAHAARVQREQELARSLGATGTPSAFINGRNVRGAQPIEAFARVIDEERARARALLRRGTPRARVYEAAIRDGSTEPRFLERAGGDGEEPEREYALRVPRDAPRRGARGRVKVTMQIFTDFQCPFCGRVQETLETLLAEYEDKGLELVFRNYPLPFHADAMLAHQAAMEVLRQGRAQRFWRYHDVLFANQSALTRENLERWATELGGIHMGRFRAALDRGTHERRVRADMEAISAAGAQIGTPSFFINGRLLQGAQPIDVFRAAIDRALRDAEGRRRRPR